jgi:hypothetical protein
VSDAEGSLLWFMNVSANKLQTEGDERGIDGMLLEASSVIRKSEAEIASLKTVLCQARSFAINAIEDRVKLKGFDSTEHSLIKAIDAVLEEGHG